MNKIKMWRENALISQAEMSRLLEIPLRTIENWESGNRKPPKYVEKLVVEKLMDIAARTIEKRAWIRMQQLKSDANGNRPVGSWAAIHEYGHGDEFIEFYDTMYEALDENDSGTIAYLICNEVDGKLDAYYEDKDGCIHSDYDFVKYVV